MFTNLKSRVFAGLHLALKHRPPLLGELDVVEVLGEGRVVVQSLQVWQTPLLGGLQGPDLIYSCGVLGIFLEPTTLCQNTYK